MNDQLQETNDLLKQIIHIHSFKRRFFSGLVSGLGATIGVAVVLAIVSYLLSQLPLVPIIGEWLSSIINESLNGTSLPSLTN